MLISQKTIRVYKKCDKLLRVVKQLVDKLERLREENRRLKCELKWHEHLLFTSIQQSRLRGATATFSNTENRATS